MKIVVSATSFADVVSAMSIADIIELRLDLFSMFPDERKLSGIEKPTIVTIRRVQEGGKYSGDERRRINLLSKYSAYANYVDLECDLQDEDFRLMKCKVIESYHNFKETPSYEYLKDLIESRRGDIFKIATMGRDKKDVLTITRVLCEYEDVVAFLMGENFAWTRIFACFLGSPFIYCSISKAVAPGQLNAKNVKRIFSLLR
ncbi:type I 3-dehydroquinate dehydratase [Archaeoglobus sp.]